ncbi:ABC transporter permease [Enterococcus sp. 669A]|uniref:ABC transporter permease n=1 Tax=Candidatus Enterococcus moelleringii TaxID=2815325 RepID=A0ABS3L8S4_9ENTE|nr:ABC transporter permease [Enterococcus sp. 669A]MBO1306044.1 ABC transporter permease [Enterococcus sp. 669A]
MNLDKIFDKLRRYNRGNYVQLIFCIAFAVFLITSFSAMLFSPTILTVLPVGGDSRKQVNMIFVIALIGCLMFAIYATGLFFKYKSRETGVFLALGASKRVLTKTFYKELAKIWAACTLVALVLGNIASVIIWQLFRVLVIDTSQMPYQFSITGTLVGLMFAVVLGLCIFVMAYIFMKRSNLMDILNEQRKNEPIQEVTRAYGLTGLVMTVLGILLGYVVPFAVASAFKINLPGLWNATYLISIVGIYRLVTYLISHHERGKRPQKYYKNIIPYSMMKSQGKQTVRNMCVMALLVLASMFALFYVPMSATSYWQIDDSPVDYSLVYPANIDELNQEDIESLAAKHDVKATDYMEVDFAELLGSGIERDWTDSGKLVEEYQEKHEYAEFISASEYEQITGKQLTVPQGGYYIFVNGPEDTWTKFDDMDQVTNPATDETFKLSLTGTLDDDKELFHLATNRYVLNDADFEAITAGISEDHQVKQLMFNVEESEAEQAFAEEVFSEFIARAPAEMARTTTYDAYQSEQAKLAGEHYDGDIVMELDTSNPDLRNYWKYYPSIKTVMKQNFLRDMAVFFLLFVYVAIICLAAVGIIAYTRSITIAINNKQLFEDLTKLGANNKYIRRTVNSQLTKIFVYPTVIGGVGMLFMMFLIFVVNDGRFSPSEMIAYRYDLLIFAAVCVYIFILYRVSFKKMLRILKV